MPHGDALRSGDAGRFYKSETQRGDVAHPREWQQGHGVADDRALMPAPHHGLAVGTSLSSASQTSFSPKSEWRCLSMAVSGIAMRLQILLYAKDAT
jgi:hypothetical protein